MKQLMLLAGAAFDLLVQVVVLWAALKIILTDQL